MNNENLINIADRSTEKQREICSKGGKASGVAKRRKKSLSEIASAIMQTDLQPKQRKQIEAMGLNPEEFNQWTACIFGLLSKASKDGDVKAVEKLQELTGETTKATTAEEQKQDNLLKAIEKAVTSSDNCKEV